MSPVKEWANPDECPNCERLRKAIEEADTYARWHCPLNDTAIDGLLSIFKKALEGASK